MLVKNKKNKKTLKVSDVGYGKKGKNPTSRRTPFFSERFNFLTILSPQLFDLNQKNVMQIALLSMRWETHIGTEPILYFLFLVEKNQTHKLLGNSLRHTSSTMKIPPFSSGPMTQLCNTFLRNYFLKCITIFSNCCWNK